MKTKFITIDPRVKFKGQKQEEENEYAVRDKASFILFVCFGFFLIIQKHWLQCHHLLIIQW